MITMCQLIEDAVCDGRNAVCVLAAGTRDLWPYLILLQAIPALLSLVVLPFIPDTPRYLLLVRRDREGAISCKFVCVGGGGSAAVYNSQSLCHLTLTQTYKERNV